MMRVFLNGDGTTQLWDTIRRNIQPEQLENPIIRAELKEVEDIYKIEGLAMYTHNWGVKSPESLSNGTKALILYSCFDKHKELISSACCGENIAPYIAQLSLVCDFYIALDYFLAIPMDVELAAIDSKTGQVMRTGREFHNLYSGRAGEPTVPQAFLSAVEALDKEDSNL